MVNVRRFTVTRPRPAPARHDAPRFATSARNVSGGGGGAVSSSSSTRTTLRPGRGGPAGGERWTEGLLAPPLAKRPRRTTASPGVMVCGLTSVSTSFVGPLLPIVVDDWCVCEHLRVEIASATSSERGDQSHGDGVGVELRARLRGAGVVSAAMESLARTARAF